MKDRGLFEETFGRTVLVRPGSITVRQTAEAPEADVSFEYQLYE
jgi:hypothetical protein